MTAPLRTPWITAVIVLFSSWASSPVGAADTREAEAELLIKDGNRLRGDGNAAAAWEQFVRAYRLIRTPRTAAQLGLCEYHLKRWVDAELHLDEALRATGHPWMEKNRETLEKALGDVRGNLGRVEVTGRPPGADVVIAGAPVGTLPLASPIRVEVGTTHIRVTADGYQSHQGSVSVKPGDVVKVHVELELIRRPEAPRPTQPSMPATVSPAWKRPAAWATSGLAVLLAGGAVASLLVADSKYDQFDRVTDAPGTQDRTCTTQAPMAGGGSCPGLLSAGNTAKNLAIGGFVLAGAAAVTAALLFVTSSSESTDDRSASLSCRPSVGVWGGACVVPF